MIVREPESQYTPAPAGVHAAVCVDVIDMGLIPNHFDPSKPDTPTVRLVWQIGEDDEKGKPFIVRKDYRASLHEKAALRQDLKSWRGRDFTPAELAGFDLDTIVSVPCLLNVVHNVSQKGGVFANIASIMPLAKGMAKLEPRDYVRMKDRPPEEKMVSRPRAQAPRTVENEPPSSESFGTFTDDDVPF